jgi:hypothetical protein
MVIAAFISFGILLAAWMVAPEGHRAPSASVDRELLELQQLAA